MLQEEHVYGGSKKTCTEKNGVKSSKKETVSSKELPKTRPDSGGGGGASKGILGSLFFFVRPNC